MLPTEVALAGVAAARGADAVTWLGHASFLIRLGGRTILTDPFLTERASPVAWFGPQRIAGPGLPPALLPPIDLLLLSHNHYDHLDLRALAQLREPGRTSVVMPLRLSRYLDTGRFAQAVELDWLQQAEVAGIRITALPAIHFSKRGLFDRNASLWCGFLLEAAGRQVLFTGDTAYGPVFAETAPRMAPPDLALVPIGAYEPRPLMAGLALHARGRRADRPRVRRQAAVRHALGHHPAHRRAGVRAAGAVPRGGRGRGLRRGRRLDAGDRRDARPTVSNLSAAIPRSPAQAAPHRPVGARRG